MFNKIFNIPEYLQLKHVGVLELMFALTPMLSGFELGGLPLSLLMWVIMLLYIFIKNNRISFSFYIPLKIFIAYWVFHLLFTLILDDTNFNGIIQQIILFVSILALSKNIDFTKLVGSLNWAALISIAGLLFQWSEITAGMDIHPIEIPGLMMPENRIETFSLRPSSFYMEPAAYVAFMYLPLAFSLIQRKFLWTSVIILSIFLTTSTTGLATSFIMLGAYALTQRNSKWTSLGVLAIGAVLVYALLHFSAFDAGIDKIENTDIETNVRLSQGPDVVKTMNSTELIFGSSYSTAYNYCIKARRAPMVVVYGESVYMSTIWLMILLYGIVGLLLYLNIYWQLIKQNRICLPLVLCLFATMFSSGYMIGGTFAYTLVALLLIVKNENIINDFKYRI